MHRIPLVLVALTLALSGCWTPPQLRGDYSTVDPGQGSAKGLTGTPVRWGGVITGARETNAGFCIEVAAYKLDPYTHRPMAPIENQDMYIYRASKANPAGRATHVSPPRFLACGDQIRDKSTYFPTSISTVTGTLGSPEVFEVDPENCERIWQRGHTDYSGTDHVLQDDRCVVSLPVVRVSQSYPWPERAALRPLP